MRLGSDCELNGNLVVAGDVAFAGRLHGHIRSSGNADISATARVAGSVRGHDVRLAGLVEGDVISTGVLTVEKSGRVLGEIYAESICIEPGANLDGPIHLGGTSAARGDATFKDRTRLDASSSTIRVHRADDPRRDGTASDVASDLDDVASLLAETDAAVGDATTETASFAQVSTGADESAENDHQRANMRMTRVGEVIDEAACEVTVRPIRMRQNAGTVEVGDVQDDMSGSMRFDNRNTAGSATTMVGGPANETSRERTWASGDAMVSMGAAEENRTDGSYDAETRRAPRSRSRGEEALRRRLAAFEARFRRSGTVAVIGQQTHPSQAVQAG